jgi:hypothetical protein
VALIEGDLDEAGREFRTDLKSAEESQIIRHQANSLGGLARVSATAGDTNRAVELHRRALALRRRMGDRLGVVDSLIGLSTVAAPTQPEESAQLVAAAVALRVGAGARATPREGAEVAAAMAAIGSVDPRLLEVANEAGADLDEDEILAIAARLGAPADVGMPERATTPGPH